MKTTELYIEQVIIGLLVLAIVALPWARELEDRIGEINIAEGSVLLGLAFLLGIPFDRFADTLTERLDRHHRLQFALDKWVGQKFPATTDNDNLERDIFAENEYRLHGLRDKDAVVNWIEYHRSRIRLARALAVYGPALTLSLTLSMARSDHAMSRYEIGIWLSTVAVGYMLWGMVADPPESLRDLLKKARLPKSLTQHFNKASTPKSLKERTIAWSLHVLFGKNLPRGDNALFSDELPRTDQARFHDYAENLNRIDNEGRVQKAPHAGIRVWSDEWRSLIVPGLVLVAALSFGVNYQPKTAWVAACGALVTVGSAWTWWRISTTYRTYLYDLS